MEQKTFALKGNIIYTKERTRFEVMEQGWLVCEEGRVRDVYSVLPEELKGIPVEDMGDRLIIPGLTDLHIHAPQYTFRSLGMDMELLEWLETNTFPEESKYKDTEYAQKAYGMFAEQLKKSATVRACIFGTIHNEATLILMDLLEEAGLLTMVGKLNRDRNSPVYRCEPSSEASAQATREWLKAVADRKYKHTKPILTPRFTPSCTDELMELLKEIQTETHLPMQSHLSENPGEIAWVKELCPWSEFYGDAYDRFGLFGADCKTVMAHCVYSGKEERQRMKENGVFIAHCPESNMNLSSGVAPVRTFLEEGMHVGIGSDVAGGSTENLFKAMALAIQASKLRWRMQDDSLKPLTLEEVFYIATKGGGEFFGNVGSFEPGFELDAVVLDDTRIVHSQNLDVRARLERMIYLADEREVRAKYVRGREICLQ